MIISRFFHIDKQYSFRQVYGNVRNHKHIQLKTTVAMRSYLVPEPRSHATIFFFKTFISHRNKKKKSKTFMNKPVYLGLSILEISKIAMYDVWYYYMKQKYGEFKKQNYLTWIQTVL